MNFVTIAGANLYLCASKEGNPEQNGECGLLPVRYEPKEALAEDLPVRLCESAWRPSAEELELLAAGGSVVLRVYGMQPPVSLYVVGQEIEDEDEPLLDRAEDC